MSGSGVVHLGPGNTVQSSRKILGDLRFICVMSCQGCAAEDLENCNYIESFEKSGLVKHESKAITIILFWQADDLLSGSESYYSP